MKQLRTQLRPNGTFVYAEDEDANCYQIVYNENVCDAVLLDSSVTFDATEFEITDTKTQYRPS